MNARLPSWRPGPTRNALLGFLDAAVTVPIPDRVAYFDNDGTLWCEKPNYIQLEFFLRRLGQRVAEDPSVAEKAEFAALLSGDQTAIAKLGLGQIALALGGLYAGTTPEEFETHAEDFVLNTSHAEMGRPLRSMVYQPMLELIDELRLLDFTVGIVTGGGTEFVRAISRDLYGVPPELVVGTLITYEFIRNEDGQPDLRRTDTIQGEANEGQAKVTNIQTQLGRRPILAAGNSAGDTEMLEWAAGENPGIALLIDHDDAEREYSYASEAVTRSNAEPVVEIASRLGWTTVSMAVDWETVFPELTGAN